MSIGDVMICVRRSRDESGSGNGSMERLCRGWSAESWSGSSGGRFRTGTGLDLRLIGILRIVRREQHSAFLMKYV